MSASGGSFSPTNNAVTLNKGKYEQLSIFLMFRFNVLPDWDAAFDAFTLPDSVLSSPQTLKLFGLF